MGTRHLIAVYLNGKYKVAQYGQWDGYPSGVGVDVLEFCNLISNPYDRSAFREKVSKCRWITDEEITERNAKINSGEIEDWKKKWPELSRDTSANILKMISNSENGMVLTDNLEFAANSLFCEWAYVIDLDKGKMEVYRGFNKTTPLSENDRFYFLRDKERPGYHGVKMVKSYALNDLPTRKEFVDELEKEDNE